MISAMVFLALASSALAVPLPCYDCHMLRPGVLPLQRRGTFNIDEVHTSLLDSYVYALDAPLSSPSIPLQTASNPSFPTTLDALNTAIPTATLTLVVDHSALSSAAISYPTQQIQADSLNREQLLKDFVGVLSNSGSAAAATGLTSSTTTLAIDSTSLMPCMPTTTAEILRDDVMAAQDAHDDFSSSVIVAYSSSTPASSSLSSALSSPTASATAESLNGANDFFKDFVGALSASASQSSDASSTPTSDSSSATVTSTGKDRAGLDSEADHALSGGVETTVMLTVTETVISAATSAMVPDDVAVPTGPAPAF